MRACWATWTSEVEERMRLVQAMQSMRFPGVRPALACWADASASWAADRRRLHAAVFSFRNRHVQRAFSEWSYDVRLRRDMKLAERAKAAQELLAKEAARARAERAQAEEALAQATARAEDALEASRADAAAKLAAAKAAEAWAMVEAAASRWASAVERSSVVDYQSVLSVGAATLRASEVRSTAKLVADEWAAIALPPDASDAVDGSEPALVLEAAQLLVRSAPLAAEIDVSSRRAKALQELEQLEIRTRYLSAA